VFTKTQHKIAAALYGGLAAFALLGAATLRAIDRYAQDAQWVTHTYGVIAELGVLDESLREAKSSVRSFLLTGDSSYIARYRRYADTSQAVLERIGRETADDPAQGTLIAQLRPLLRARITALNGTASLGPASVLHNSARVMSALSAGEMMSEHVGQLVGSMRYEERRLLGARIDAQRESEGLIRVLIVLAVLLGVVVVWLAHRSIRLDLDARRRAELSLRESEAKFSGILAIAADAVITTDAARRILHFNRGAQEIFGYAEREVTGLSLEMLMPSRFGTMHEARVEQFSRGTESSRRMGERRLVFGRRRSGEEFPAEVSISKLATADGWIFTAVVRDVTERVKRERFEHLLAEAGKRLVGSLDYETVLRSTVALCAPGIGDWCILDLVESQEGNRRSWRRIASSHDDPERDAAMIALEQHGINDDSPSRALDVLRRGTLELLPDVSDDWLESYCDQEELPLMRALGARSLLLMPLVTGGRPLGVLTIGTARDGARLSDDDVALAAGVADRAALAITNALNFMNAQRATRSRDEVLSAVSHDLRNSLSGVSVCARTLADHPPADDRERQQLYHVILDGAALMQRLIQDLLDVASIEAGRLSMDREPQSLPAILEASLPPFVAQGQQIGVTVRSLVSGHIPLVNVDSTRIMQVIGNLVGNALKFAPCGSAIVIGAEQRGADVRVSVRDEGPGIQAEHLTKIFDRFWHLKGAGRSRGTGLGLAIAKGIITAHGGRIWAESSPGEGSTFYFTLPTVNAPGSLGMSRHPSGVASWREAAR
jgi:PAS domain S-box-containing protein